MVIIIFHINTHPVLLLHYYYYQQAGIEHRAWFTFDVCLCRFEYQVADTVVWFTGKLCSLELEGYDEGRTDIILIFIVGDCIVDCRG